MMHVPEGRDLSLTLGGIRSLEDDDGENYGNFDGANVRGKGGKEKEAVPAAAAGTYFFLPHTPIPGDVGIVPSLPYS